MLQVLRHSRIVESHPTYLGLNAYYAFLTPALILQTYSVSHKNVLLFNYSDSDSE